MTAVCKPIVLVPACQRLLGQHPYHVVGRKYADAVRLAGCQALVVPGATPDELDLLLDLADGLLLSGSPSNVHPSHFDEGVHNPELPLDTERDDWTLPLIPKALARGVPLLAICRGAQEVNVALGGSLHQAVQEVPGYNDHRANDAAQLQAQYAPAHEVNVEAGGVLARVIDRMNFPVNSLHTQAVSRLADGLRVEARSPDGVIEAFSKPEARGFNLCLQWHPEWQAQSNPVSVQLLAAFGAACREYRSHKSNNTNTATR